MRRAMVKIDMLSYWVAGSGSGRARDVDAVIIRDKDNLPYIPGRTLRGLLREACQTAEDCGEHGVPAGTTNRLFGTASTLANPTRTIPGILSIDDSRLSSTLSAKWRADTQSTGVGLVEVLSSTAIDDRGQADNHTLRSIEVAIPLSLTSQITGPDDDWTEVLEGVLPLLRQLGSHRHRGLGRCRVSMTSKEAIHAGPEDSSPRGTSAWYRVDLRSDVIVSRSGATEGGHEGLDYIPGGTILGATVGSWIRQWPFDPTALIGGGIRISTALPLHECKGICHLGYPTPATFYCLKGGKLGEGGKPIDGRVGDQQIYELVDMSVQQMRGGYVTSAGHRLQVRRNQVTKSAIDRDSAGRPRDSMLFGYQSIACGQSFAFQVEADCEELLARADSALLAPKVRLGRSRGAEFANVLITRMSTSPTTCDAMDFPKEVVLYAASDWAIERDGSPVLCPQPADLGLPSLSIDWTRTIIRTRTYSPWNEYHGVAMTERQVIAAGSVITLKLPEAGTSVADTIESLRSRGIGRYRHEGLGRVLMNPAFVLFPPVLEEREAATAQLPEAPVPEPSAPERLAIDCVARRNGQAAGRNQDHAAGQNWAGRWFENHRRIERAGGEPPGKSQWSAIRNLAKDLSHGQPVRRLVDELCQFCTESTRAQRWNAGSDMGLVTMWETVRSTLESPDHGAADVATALHHASDALGKMIAAHQEESAPHA
jgi:CRISPR/Cas system CSM-associated protein Csm3 (group 7 of RAMP superfamily)